MKTLFNISKFLFPVAFILAVGYFLLPTTNRSSPAEPHVEEAEVEQPKVEERTVVVSEEIGKEALQKKSTISKRTVPPPIPIVEMAKSDDAFENVSSALELGQMLFWDPVLSGNKDVACATCHHPNFAYADSRDLSIGTLGVGLGPSRMQTEIPPVKRNAHTIVNTVFNGLNAGRGRGRGQGQGDLSKSPLDPEVFQTINQAQAPMFWDSRVKSLEAQSLEPIKAYDEMRGSVFTKTDALDSVVARLKNISDYMRLFKKVYGEETIIDASLIGTSIAEFERSLVAVNSPFDKYMAGDKEALTEQQLRGMDSFRDVGCANCHRGTMFSDFQLHTLGIPENSKLDSADSGAGRFRFRTPTLRNVALTAPFMHNGMFETLEQVLQFYNNGRSENPNVVNGGRGGRGGGRGGPGNGQNQGQGADNNLATLDGNFRRIDNMNAGQMSDIVAFLKALTDENFNRTIPTVVPSGLQPGGLISALK